MTNTIFHFFRNFLIAFLVVLTNVSCQKPSVTNNDLVKDSVGYKLSSTSNTKRKALLESADWGKMDGMTMVAPPKPFSENPYVKMKAIDVNWVGVIPYGFTRTGKPSVGYGSSWQWWGETIKGVTESVQLAHSNGLMVLLKPQVYVPGSWPGGLTFKSDADWKQWEASYEKYILTFAKIAAEQQVDLFCIGTEFKVSSTGRPEFWENLIIKIKKIYTGKLTYAANWDEYKHITFWDKLDYIGVDAYFPLSDEAIPSVEELVSEWTPYEKELQRVSQAFDRPIIFTEYGYMSVEGCAGKTWVLESNRSILKYNEQAQANAFDAVYEVFYDKDYWAGGFIWKWYPGEFSGPKKMRKDYTPQNKIGEQTLAKWYAK